jgi:hypothetical protein
MDFASSTAVMIARISYKFDPPPPPHLIVPLLPLPLLLLLLVVFLLLQCNTRYNLGLCYLKGKGVGENTPEAVKLLTVAANRGLVVAQYDLATFWRKQYNGSEAARLLRLAAEQGHAMAQNDLGLCYESGECGVEKNASEAVRLCVLTTSLRCAFFLLPDLLSRCPHLLRFFKSCACLILRWLCVTRPLLTLHGTPLNCCSTHHCPQ